MPAHRSRKSPSIATRAAELALAVPQVVAHRVARMAIAGPSLSKRDRKEFDLMVAEKKAAFHESWSAMAAQAFRANQALTASFFQSFWSPLPGRKRLPSSVATQFQSAALGIVGKGLAPIHRKAVANAKRLARTKLR
jgi:hypothetical protein